LFTFQLIVNKFKAFSESVSELFAPGTGKHGLIYDPDLPPPPHNKIDNKKKLKKLLYYQYFSSL
jgi:hypothetical protein